MKKYSILLFFFCVTSVFLTYLLFSCGKDDIEVKGVPSVLFPTDVLHVDLNRANLPVVVAVIKSPTGLKSVSTYILKGDVETETEDEVSTFFNPNSYSVNQTPVYTEDMTGFKVVATDLAGQVTVSVLPFEVVPLVNAPTVVFNDGNGDVTEMTYREKTEMPRIIVTVSSEEDLKYLTFGQVVGRIETIIPFEGNDTIFIPGGRKTYTIDLTSDGYEFALKTTAIKVVVAAGDLDKLKRKVGTLRINYIEMLAPQVVFDGDEILQPDEFQDVSVSGRITSESGLESVRLFKVTNDGDVFIKDCEISDPMEPLIFSTTINHILSSVTGVRVVATDLVGKSTDTIRVIRVNELEAAPAISMDQEKSSFNGLTSDQDFTVSGSVDAPGGLASFKYTSYKRDGSLLDEHTEPISGEKSKSYHYTFHADKAFGKIIIEAVDNNTKVTRDTIETHVDYYYYNLEASCNGLYTTGYQDPQPGCFFSAATGSIYPFCEAKAIAPDITVGFATYASNTRIQVVALTENKFSNRGSCGLETWSTVHPGYLPPGYGLKTSTGIKRDRFYAATITDMKAESTGASTGVILSGTDLVTPTTNVALFDAPVYGVTKRIILTFDKIIEVKSPAEMTTFMIHVKIEK